MLKVLRRKSKNPVRPVWQWCNYCSFWSENVWSSVGCRCKECGALRAEGDIQGRKSQLPPPMELSDVWIF